ncbi:MAG: hydrolase [Microbacterium sp.]|jgi:CubicO group peptidase (beta-lactamase class C family)|uniref:serine hydrolase domain-containing protein n=1 Tax=Microbacterium sp. TaxID=51671 RepID=UPI00261EA5EB|nr:serine hydrolase [Microbacterium sp.]MDF2561502.1 hydrolase [Microbacterium sp.]
MSAAEAVRDRIVEAVQASGFGAHGLHVRIGAAEAAYRWTPDVREDVHSVAKGICVLAAAIAADEGTISFDEPVTAYLPDFEFGAGAEQVTLRHLLTMSSGIDLPWSETLMTDWPDLAREFLRRPSSGRVFQYSNASTYTAMSALSARVGDVGDYLDARLFRPLGIADAVWARSPNGRIEAGGGLPLTTSEMARIGLLIRDRGMWRGTQLVSPGWIDAMHENGVVAGPNPGYDRYALAGWGGPGRGWRLHGAHGQLLIFLDDAVVTITAADHFGADEMAATVVDILETAGSAA